MDSNNLVWQVINHPRKKETLLLQIILKSGDEKEPIKLRCLANRIRKGDSLCEYSRGDDFPPDEEREKLRLLHNLLYPYRKDKRYLPVAYLKLYGNKYMAPDPYIKSHNLFAQLTLENEEPLQKGKQILDTSFYEGDIIVPNEGITGDNCMQGILIMNTAEPAIYNVCRAGWIAGMRLPKDWLRKDYRLANEKERYEIIFLMKDRYCDIAEHDFNNFFLPHLIEYCQTVQAQH